MSLAILGLWEGHSQRSHLASWNRVIQLGDNAIRDEAGSCVPSVPKEARISG